MLEERRHAADGADFAVDIVQRDVAFGRRIEFQNLWNPKARLEFLPYVGAQSVAGAQPKPMCALARVRRRVDKIAAQLADILEQRAVPLDDIVPEALHREFFGDHDRATADQQRTGRYDAADRVIERKAVIDAIVRPGLHQSGEPQAPLQQPVMADIGRLRQSGRTGRVNRQRAVGDAHAAALRSAQRRAGEFFDLLIDALEAAAAMRPDLRCACDRRRAVSFGQFAGDDHVPRCDDIDAMRQRRTAQLRVEEGDHAADSGNAEPDCEIIRPVRHQEADGFALAEILLQRPARVTVGAFGEHLIGQRLTLRDQCRRCHHASVLRRR